LHHTVRERAKGWITDVRLSPMCLPNFEAR
jgi:hypothetical protein